MAKHIDCEFPCHWGSLAGHQYNVLAFVKKTFEVGHFLFHSRTTQVTIVLSNASPFVWLRNKFDCHTLFYTRPPKAGVNMSEHVKNGILYAQKRKSYSSMLYLKTLYFFWRIYVVNLILWYINVSNSIRTTIVCLTLSASQRDDTWPRLWECHVDFLGHGIQSIEHDHNEL